MVERAVAGTSGAHSDLSAPPLLVTSGPLTLKPPYVGGGARPGGMAEGGVGAYPQVFVVDSQANYVSLPTGKKPRWARAAQKFLLLLVGFTTLGLIIEGYLIYNLYKKTEAFSICKSHTLCQNLSNPKASGQQGGNIMNQVGSKESNDIHAVQTQLQQLQQRPFAQVIGTGNRVGEGNVVQWLHEGGDTIIHNMGYSNGRLLVQKEGYYYLYSKVTANAAQECRLTVHRVMKVTKAYDKPIPLMRSKNVRCATPKPTSSKSSGGEDLWNSFLSGIFHLQSGDEIYVELEDVQKLRPGPADNLMGAFMISP